MSALVKTTSTSGRRSLARSIAEQLTPIERDEPIKRLLGVGSAPALDVRTYCETPRAQSVLTVNGLWGTRALLQSSIPDLSNLHRCGPITVRDILTALLVGLTEPTAQECLPLNDEDEKRLSVRYVPSCREPLTAQGFMAAIRGRGSPS